MADGQVVQRSMSDCVGVAEQRRAIWPCYCVSVVFSCTEPSELTVDTSPVKEFAICF